MKIAIMQPYLFPYIGYFQLINAVDKFIILDDVNYIKRGWVNRNRILLHGNIYQFTIQMDKASQNKLFTETYIKDDFQHFLSIINDGYSKSIYFEPIMLLLKEILSFNNKCISIFAGNSLIKIAKYLNLKTEFIYSSNIEQNKELKGQDKILNICKLLKTDKYINAIGGMEIYSREVFLQNNIELNFIQTKEIRYQHTPKIKDFYPNLSIIDILMNNSIKDISLMLNQFSLI